MEQTYDTLSPTRAPLPRIVSPRPARMPAMRKACLWAVAIAFVSAGTAVTDAQDMMRNVDLSSPEMTTAEMTRAQVEAAVAAAAPSRAADFTGKRLSGLDLSGLD